ncbi:MAG: hypothetical protein ACPH5I_03180 [Amylibacter sp.]
MARIIAAMSGLIISFLVLENLSEEEQGFLYLMLSMRTFTLLTELGFYNVLVTYLSGCKIGDQTKNILKVENWEYLSVLKKAKKWYILIAFIFFVIVLTWGYYSLLIFNNTPDLLAPWIVSTISLALTLYLNHILAAIEALNDVAFVYVCRFKAAFYSLLFGIITMLSHQPLWSPAVIFLTTTIIVFYQLFKNYRNILFINFQFSLSLKQTISLKVKTNQMINMQWKMALSTLSGFLAFSVIVPITFFFSGAINAGKMGISLTFVTALLSIGTALTAPKVSTMANLNNNKNFSVSLKLMKRTSIFIFILTTLSSLSLLFILMILEANGVNYFKRMVSQELLFLLLFSGVSSSVILPIAYWLRSFGNEPLLGLSIVTGIFTFVGLIIGNIFGNIESVIIIYCVITFLSSLAVIFKYHMKINYLIGAK